MANSLKKICLLIMSIICSLTAMGQNSDIFKETTFIKCFGLNEFGKLFFINDINEDSNGCIILSTTDGITIMNSNKNTFLVTPRYSGVNKTICDNRGNIIACGDIDNGYFRFTDDGKNEFINLSNEIDNKNEKITNAIATDSTTWMIGSNNIFIDNHKTIKRLGLSNIKTSFSYNGTPIIVTRDGGMHIPDGPYKTKEIINIKEIAALKDMDFHAVNMMNDTIYLITNNHIIKVNAKKLTCGEKINPRYFKTTDLDIKELKNTVINDAQYDNVLKKIAIATSQGIIILTPEGKFTETINDKNGLPINDTKKLFFDSKHNLWASLNTLLAKIELSTTTVYYTEKQGISGDIYCFEKYHDQYYCSTFNEVYTATADNNGYNTIFHKVNFGNATNITCWNLQVINDNLLACTVNGLYRIEGQEAYHVLNSNKIYSIAQTPRLPGVILIAAYDGLYYADYTMEGKNMKFNKLTKVKGIDFPVWSIQTDKNGMIWISSIFDGLYYIVPKDKEFSRYSLVNIGQNNNLKELRQTRFFVSDKYLYTYGNNIRRAELPQTLEFVSSDIDLKTSELFSNYINNYESTDIYPLGNNGDVFICTNKNYILANRESKTFDTIRFQTDIKMVNNIFLRDSILFLSTNIGLLKHNLKAKPQDNPSRYPFKTMISGIYSNDSTLFDGIKYFGNNEYIYSPQDGKPYEMGRDVRSLKIKYTTSCYENPEMIMYSYKLDGQSENWSAYSTENYHEFGQLSPGEYTFRVKARNHYGIISNEAIFHFRIDRIIFLRWWAIMLYIIIFAAIIYTPLQQKIIKYKKENARLDKLAQERYDEIIRQNERLKLLSLVASKNTNCVLILLSNGKLHWANDSFKDVYGYTLEEYKQEYGDNYFQAQQMLSPYTANTIKEAIDNKQRSSFENIHIGPNGHKVYVQTHLDPVFDDQNETINWIVTETNITQLKLAEKEGQEKNEKLTLAYSDLKKNQSKMEFQTKQLKMINERLEIGYKEIKRHNTTINQSLRYAQSIQRSILPSKEKFGQYCDSFIIYKPKDIVSGDFYMCEEIDSTSFIIIVADCTGHGVPGAFMSIIGYDILTQLIKMQKIYEPGIILEKLSKQLMMILNMNNIQNTDGMALSICKLNKGSNDIKLTFAGSGSNIIIHRTESNELERIRGSRRQIGLNGESKADQPFEQNEFTLSYNDRVFQLTDGIIDQCNEKRIRFGSQRLHNFIKNNVKTPICDMRELLENDIKRFSCNTEQRDDITILGYKINR